MTTTRQPPTNTTHQPAGRVARRLLWQSTIAATLTTTGCTTAPRALPGPTGIIIRLDPNQVATLTTNYQWTPAAASQEVAITPALRPFAPAHAHWSSSPRYTNHIQGTKYTGPVWVDLNNANASSNATIYLNLTG